MDREPLVQALIEMLLQELPNARVGVESFPKDYDSQRFLLRSLMNIWPAEKEPPAGYYALQDRLLRDETNERGVVHVDKMLASPADDRIALFYGDICTLDADAIVNAANEQLLGCFRPGHLCIDNCIHSAAGLQLRRECYRIMAEQGHDEEPGGAKITSAYNLPSSHVIHTVGPIVNGSRVTTLARATLGSCYTSCLDLAHEQGLRNIAFCCISTGVYGFPKSIAAQVAVGAVRRWLDAHVSDVGVVTTSVRRVVFCLFEDEDAILYEKLLDKEGA